MMTKKTLSTWAIVMVIVFGGLVVLYPMIFHSEHEVSTPADGGPGPVTPNMPTPPPPTIPPIK